MLKRIKNLLTGRNSQENEKTIVYKTNLEGLTVSDADDILRKQSEKFEILINSLGTNKSDIT
jgi:hypothetical protein